MRRLAALTACAAALAAAAPAGAIYHGAPVAPGDAPWSVALTARGHLACGGALIARDRVLTAAHCVAGVDPARLHLRLGGARWQQGRELPWRGAVLPTTYRVLPSPVRPQDLMDAGTVDDVAVLLLRAPVAGVTPLAVAGDAPTAGEEARTIGRGRTGSGPVGGEVTDAPRAAVQTVQPADACGRAYGPALFHPDRHLCTLDGSSTAAQACAGDSGSPVTVRRDGAPAVAGVVTWGGETQGRTCGQGLPDVSERVGPHRALLSATPHAVSPWALRRVRVRRSQGTLRCVIGAWRPASARFRVRWYRGTAGAPVTVPGGAPTHRASRRPLGCTVTATTDGGVATEISYNQL